MYKYGFMKSRVGGSVDDWYRGIGVVLYGAESVDFWYGGRGRDWVGSWNNKGTVVVVVRVRVYLWWELPEVEVEGCELVEVFERIYDMSSSLITDIIVTNVDELINVKIRINQWILIYGDCRDSGVIK